MTYRVRCKRMARMVDVLRPWAYVPNDWETHWYMRVRISEPKRRAWPAVSRKDALERVYSQWHAEAKASGKGVYFPLGEPETEA